MPIQNAQKAPEDRQDQGCGDGEVREGRDHQQGIRLGHVDIEWERYVTHAPRILDDHPDPAQPGTEGDQ